MKKKKMQWDIVRNHLHLVYLQLKSRTQYKVDFGLELFAVLVTILFPLLLIKYVIDARGEIAGWDASDAAMLIAVMMIARGIVDLVFDGVWSLRHLVNSGDLDILIVRPSPVVGQVASCEVSIDGLSSLIVGLGLVVFGWTGSHSFGPLSIVITVGSILGSVILLSCIDLISNCIAFWDRSAYGSFPFAMASLTELAKYPMDMFDRPIRLILTTVIPVALVVYEPMSVALGKSELKWSTGLVQFGVIIVFLVFAHRVWIRGLRSYESTGS